MASDGKLVNQDTSCQACAKLTIKNHFSNEEWPWTCRWFIRVFCYCSTRMFSSHMTSAFLHRFGRVTNKAEFAYVNLRGTRLISPSTCLRAANYSGNQKSFIRASSTESGEPAGFNYLFLHGSGGARCVFTRGSLARERFTATLNSKSYEAWHTYPFLLQGL